MKPLLEKAFFALVRSAINGEKLGEDEKNVIQTRGLSGLFALAKQHDLAHLMFVALQNNGLLTETSAEMPRFLQEWNLAVYRRETQQYVLAQVGALLDGAEIPYLPLKGSVLCALYPESWMRTSCDIDVLVEQKNLEKAVALLSENGFVCEGDHYHDVSLHSPEGVHLELHYELIEERDSMDCHALLEDIWAHVLPVDDKGYEKKMPDELFVLYHVAHTAKHFVYGGCGIRPFLDFWIMQSKMSCDTQKLQKLLQESGLQTFYEYTLKLTAHWFENGETDEVLQGMKAYIWRGGVYGTAENQIAVNREHPKGKAGNFFSSVFVSYENLWHSYPALKGKKWLTPVYQVRRWFRILFKGISKSKREELKAYGSVSKEEKQEMQRVLDGLDLCKNRGKGF